MFSAVNGGDGSGYPRPYANPSAAIYFIISQVHGFLDSLVLSKNVAILPLQLILKSFVVEMFACIGQLDSF